MRIYETDSIIITSTVHKNIIRLPRKKQLKMWEAIFDHYFNHCPPECLSRDLEPLFELITKDLNSKNFRYGE